MWSVDMSRCPACQKKKTCPDRVKFALELQEIASAQNREIAADPERAEAGGDGLIIVSCGVTF